MTLIDLVEDVIGAKFAGEQEAVLWIPCSGDVLRCSAMDWNDLKECPSDPRSKLKMTLLGLGSYMA